MVVTLDGPWAGDVFAPPTPVDIASIESAIAAQLRFQISAIEIAQFPDKPAAYRLTHRVGAALVAWRGATYGRLIDTAAVVQSRRLEFEISLIVRDLGWSFGKDASGPAPGAYALIEAVRAALTGFEVPGCRKMFPLREQFLGRDSNGGAWTWSAFYALETMALESSAQDNFPTFIKGLALEDGGQTRYATATADYTFDAQDTIHLPVVNVDDLRLAPTANGESYIAGADYTLDNVNGVITRIASGAIAPGATVATVYSYSDSVVALAGGSAAPTAPSN